MKIEIDLLEADLKDRQVAIEMRAVVEEKISQLSAFAQNNLPNQLNNLRSALEQVENAWLKWQKERVLNKFSEALNVDRDRLGDKAWSDNYY
jgi:hypothetical protein